MHPAQVMRELDNRLRPPRHHARLWGKGRSKAASKRRLNRGKLKELRWVAKMVLHSTNYGMHSPALLLW